MLEIFYVPIFSSVLCLHGHCFDADFLDHDGPRYDRFRDHSGCALLVFVLLVPLPLDVGDIESSEILNVVVGLDNAEVDVATGTHVVEDARSDGVAD